MQRLTGIDAWYVYDESAEEPQQTLKVLVLGQGSAARYRFVDAKRELGRRLQRVPRLLQRPLRVPLDLHHPVWVPDPHFDLDHHVRRVALPAPGGRRALCEVLSELVSVPVETDRPLWQGWFVEGFEEDRLVFAIKMSHAIADGGLVRELLEQALDGPAPEPADGPRPASQNDRGHTARLPPLAPRMPRRRELASSALRDLARDAMFTLPERVRTQLDARRRQAVQAARDPMPSAVDAPKDGLGGRLGLQRALGWASVDLDAVRVVKQRFGGSFTDILVAAVAGGVRRYLARAERLPSRPILGILVGSIRHERPSSPSRNRITTRTMWLPTEIADPVERLAAAGRAVQAARQDMERSAGAHFEDWVELFPPLLVKALTRTIRLGVRLTGVSAGVTISNVVGPARPLTVEGLVVEDFVSFGYLKYAAGLNVVAWSYGGRLNLGLCACRDHVPDVWRLAEEVERSFEELFALPARQPTDGDAAAPATLLNSQPP